MRKPADRPRKPAAPEPDPARAEERGYYAAAESAGLRFFEAGPGADVDPRTEKDVTDEH